MPAVSILTARQAIPRTPPGQHPKAYLRTEDVQLELMFAPRGGNLEGGSPTFEQQPRAGRRPLVIRTGDGLRSLSHTYILGHTDYNRTVEPDLEALRRIAAAGDRVTLVNLSTAERGPWVISSVAEAWELRQHGTNNISRATVTVTYLEESAADVKLGPIKGGKKGGKGGKLPTKHTVKAGETLSKIADRYYGEPSRWQLIARENKVTKPDKLKVGQVLTIPRLPGDKDDDKGGKGGKPGDKDNDDKGGK